MCVRFARPGARAAQRCITCMCACMRACARRAAAAAAAAAVQGEGHGGSTFEVGCAVVFAYGSYLAADAVHCSGIVAVVVNGMVMSMYVKPNLSKAAAMKIEVGAAQHSTARTAGAADCA